MKRRLKLLLLYVARGVGLFALARRATRGRLRILCYHGFELADETRFRPTLFMRADTFDARMSLVKRLGCDVLPLDDAIARLASDSLPGLPVAITIDDGWYSTYALALPVLAKHRLPATVYVTTYYVEKRRPIFRLAVQYLFWKCARSSVSLEGVIPGAPATLTMSDATAVEAAQWQIVRYGEASGSETERGAIVARLGAALHVDLQPLESGRIMSLMTPEEIAAAARDGVDIQLHTHRHVFAPETGDACAAELTTNARILETLTGREARHFCYPSGVWSPSGFDILRAGGILSATTCEPGLNTRQSNRFALSRFLDGSHVTPLEFEAELSGFADYLRGMGRRLRGGSQSGAVQAHPA